MLEVGNTFMILLLIQSSGKRYIFKLTPLKDNPGCALNLG